MNVLPLGLIHVCGKHDTGKTTFALNCGAPAERICFFDSDIKGDSVVKQLKDAGKQFGAYYDVVAETKGMLEVDRHIWYKDKINSLPDNKFDCIIFDTWETFADTMHPYVESHMPEFRKKWSPMGTIKGAQQWQSSFVYEADFFSTLLSKAPLIIAVTHMKSHVIGGVRTGKVVPSAKKGLIAKATLRVWLLPSQTQYPDALILKRIGKVTETENGIETVQVLPRKVKEFTWDKIRHYMENPVGSRELTEDEIPNRDEISIIEGSLNDEERKVLEIASMFGSGVGEEEDEDENLPVDDILKLKSEGKSIKQIADELKIAIPKVAGVLAKNK